MPGVVREALARHLERVRADLSPPPSRIGRAVNDEESGAEAVLWELLGSESYAGATRTSSPKRRLERSLCASPDEYATFEKTPTPTPNAHPSGGNAQLLLGPHH